jgi:hypothetical protein
MGASHFFHLVHQGLVKLALDAQSFHTNQANL